MSIERGNEWFKPGTIFGGIATFIALGTILWSAATIEAGYNNLASSFGEFRADTRRSLDEIKSEIQPLSALKAQLAIDETNLAKMTDRLGPIELDHGDLVRAKDDIARLRTDVDALNRAANAPLASVRR